MIEIRVRVHCSGARGQECSALVEAWVSADLDRDGGINRLDHESLPEGWTHFSEDGGWYSGYRCPEHSP
jgi:hypothetical protein